MLRLSLNNHERRLRARIKLFQNDKEKDDLCINTFHRSGHNGLKDVSIKLINKKSNELKLVNIDIFLIFLICFLAGF